ncbi:MAG: hypothetical protein OCC46_08070 [Pseudodesulfovibrio sp.]
MSNKFKLIDDSSLNNSASNEEELNLSAILEAEFHQLDQDPANEPDSPPAYAKPLRTRTMSAEKTAECGKILAVNLHLRPDGDVINLTDVCKEFNCARNIGHAIIREAVNRVRRFFEIVEGDANSSPIQIPTLSIQSLVIGKTHFNHINECRSNEAKFTDGDKFEIEFSESDYDKVILTRVHRVSDSIENTEVQND